jgi:predicted phage terminase large subunit-like protein
MASKRFPAFVMGHRPETEVVSVSASSPLAEEFGGAVRNCVDSYEYKRLFPDVKLVEDTRAKGMWATSQGGGYFACGIGGQIYGKGGELGIIDDPFASWEDGQSELSRKRVWDWYTGSFYNRMRPGAAIVVIQHRMHETDLIGMLKEAEGHGGDRWKVISLPADLDDPPWIERYDREALERIKSNMPLRKWSSLYGQNPTPDEGDEFKREWFQYYTDLPKSLTYYISSDMAVTDESLQRGDYTEIAVWGVDHAKRIFVVDWWSGREQMPVWIKEIVGRIKFYRPLSFVGEAGVIRRAAEPYLTSEMMDNGALATPYWLPRMEDKTALSSSFKALCAMRRVFWPKTSTAERVIEQLIKFPGGRYDDAVDTCSLFGRHIADVFGGLKDPEPIKQTDWDAPMRIGDFRPAFNG